MPKFESYPMLVSTLSKLLNKTQKTWGYLQVKKTDKFYVLQISGSSETMLKVRHNESSYEYKLYWGKNEKPDVFVKITAYEENPQTNNSIKPKKYTKKNTKAIAILGKKSGDKKSDLPLIYKTYEVFYKINPDSLIDSINKIFAELVKDKITRAAATNQTTKNVKISLVTVTAI